MRALFAPALIVSTLSMGALLSTLTISGCDQKSGAEKRAEELAASASAQKAAAASAAAVEDPAEVKYKERKASLEKTLKAYRADIGRILAGDAMIKPGLLRPYFEAGDAADKSVKELETKLKKDGTDGVRLRKVHEPIEIRLAGNMEDAEVEIIEERSSKNTSACFQAAESWKFAGEKWVLKQQKTVQKVDCP